jgi:hypothetical protein
MRAKVALTLGLVALLASVLLGGCGEEEGEEALMADEGQPLHLGDLIYNVAITRFLNPNELSDVEYLAGQPPEPPGESYLGVFLLITNDNEDEAFVSADAYQVTDASGRFFEPLESESPFALEIGATVDADGTIPVPDTTAAEGPVQGALLLFLVDDNVSEERPLELEIESPEGTGVVELDI